MQSIFNPKVERARMFAHTSHGSQKYGGEFAYIMHLQAVVSVLIRYGIDNVDMLCAGWLHDVLEDAYDDVEEGSKIIESLFGRDVLEIVQAVTEPKGGNRKWRHEQTYPRIAKDVRFVVVKLADRIANIEAGGTKIDMYRKEHADFKAALGIISSPYKQQGFWWLFEKIEMMWNYLDWLIVEMPPTKKLKLDPSNGP